MHPTFELYVSPINLDPRDAGDADFDARVVCRRTGRATGRFYTQGMAEDTKALNESVLTRAEFLQQARLVGEESQGGSTGYVLDGIEAASCSITSGTRSGVAHDVAAPDPAHPAYDPAADPPFSAVVEESVRRLRRSSSATTLVEWHRTTCSS